MKLVTQLKSILNYCSAARDLFSNVNILLTSFTEKKLEPKQLHPGAVLESGATLEGGAVLAPLFFSVVAK